MQKKKLRILFEAQLNRYSNCLCTFFGFMFTDEIVKKNPFAAVKKLPEAKQKYMAVLIQLI